MYVFHWDTSLDYGERGSRKNERRQRFDKRVSFDEARDVRALGALQELDRRLARALLRLGPAGGAQARVVPPASCGLPRRPGNIRKTTVELENHPTRY